MYIKENLFLNLDLFKYLYLFIAIFLIGVFGLFLTRRNLLLIIMSIELMLIAVNMYLIICSTYIDDSTGHFFSLYILTIAAAEAAIGLALIVIYYRLSGLITIDYISNIKG